MARSQTPPSALPEERIMFDRKSRKSAGRNLSIAKIQPSRRAHRRTRVELLAESLEERVLLATKTWTGAVDTGWNTPGNWQGGVPATGDDLVFPDVASN